MNDIAHSNGPGMARAFRDMYTGTQHTFSSEKTCTETGKLMPGLIGGSMALTRLDGIREGRNPTFAPPVSQ